ncbi:HD domain-containing protein [Pseudomonadota bacterium]
MTEQEIQEVIIDFHVPRNIVDHMKEVDRVALLIGKKLIENGEELDLHLIHTACMLHDLFKLCDFEDINMAYLKEEFTEEDKEFWREIIRTYHKYGHVIAAYKYFQEKGENKLATIIKKHDYFSLVEERLQDRPNTWEEKLLYYADKRVLNDLVVSLEHRLEDGRKRYHQGVITEKDKQVEKKLYELEAEIFTAAGISDDDTF